MKKIITIISFCALCTSAFSQYYYYYFDEKIPLIINTDYIYVSSNLDIDHLSTSLGSDFEVVSWGRDYVQNAVNQQIEEKTLSKSLIKVEVRLKNKLSEIDYLTLIDKLKNNNDISYVSPCYARIQGSKVETSHLFWVKLKSIADTTELSQMTLQTKSRIIGEDKFLPLWFILYCDKNTMGNSLEMANLFYESGHFETAEPEFFKCLKQSSLCDNTDPLFPDQWNLQNTGQASPFGSMTNGTPGIDIDVCQAWGITTGSHDVITAVIDNGFQLNHPDLVDNVTSNGFDASSMTLGSQVHTGGSNENDHATEIAGIIAASQNNIGVSGVAPNSGIISVSIDFNSSSDVTLAHAITWASQTGLASVINISTIDNINASDIPSSPTTAAIASALANGRNGLGCVVVCAAGNDATQVEVPANLNTPTGTVTSTTRVPISVGGIDRCGIQAGQMGDVTGTPCDPWSVGSLPASDFGTDLSVVAPATNINTCVLQGDGIGGGDYTNAASGTSFAAPHVAGIAALILSVNPCLTAREVTDRIESTCSKVDPTNGNYGTGNTARTNGSWGTLHGYGLVDAYAAVNANSEFLQAMTETTTVVRRNLGNIYAGFDVNPSIATGDYIISSGANVEIKSPTSIIFKPGFKAVSGSVMLAHIESFNGDCSDWVMNKTNYIAPNTLNSLIDNATNNKTSDLISIFPNPFTDNINIALSIIQNQTPVNINITNMEGQLVYQKSTTLDAGNSEISLSFDSPASIYMIKVCAGTYCQTDKIVKYATY